MSAPLVSTERRDDGVAVVRLENPKVNALSSEVLRQLRSAAEALTETPPGAVVVTGGDRVFAAGADIAEFAGPDEARLVGGLFLDALNAVAAIPRATIAAVSGFALGGGCELALACDWRVASDDGSTKIGLRETQLGIRPAWGGSSRLPRLIGLPAALGSLQALFMEMAPGQPLMSRDNLDSMKVDNVASGRLPGLQALGIQPASLQAIAPLYLGPGPGDAVLVRRKTAGRF